MLFNSIQFLLFFPIVTTIFFLLPHRFRWAHLLAASCVFYCAFIPIYILILFFTIGIDYVAGILIENAQGRARKFYLLMSVISNLGVLAFFKYYNFFIENVNELFSAFHIATHPLPLLSIILPLGLSFHTFQAMSYTIEVYRGNQIAERHLGIYSLYVMFYPQLVAGPIERPQHMIPQFREEKHFEFDNVVAGLQQMIWGLFKKVVVADQLSIYVNSIFTNWELNTGLTLVVAAVAFSFQVYGDFSGYSDIAQGSARVMGFRLMNNFTLPFYSSSVTEFWKRWHISLNSWFNDYLFTPLAVSLRNWGSISISIAIFVTFFFSGLWHGAAWKFIMCGLLHGVAVNFEFFSRKVRKSVSKKVPNRLYHYASVFVTFSYVTGAWIFFRAATFRDAVGILKNMFQPAHFWNLRIQDTGIFAGMVLTLAFLLCFEWVFIRPYPYIEAFTPRSWKTSATWIVSFALLIVLFGVSDGDQFIYFQF